MIEFQEKESTIASNFENINKKFSYTFEDKERSKEIKEKYEKTLENLSFSEDISEEEKFLIKKELDQLRKDQYNNLGKNFRDTILKIIYSSRDKCGKYNGIKFQDIEKMINKLKYYKSCDYLVYNLLKDPLDFVNVRECIIKFDNAFSFAHNCLKKTYEYHKKYFIEKFIIGYIFNNQSKGFYYYIEKEEEERGIISELFNFYKKYNIKWKDFNNGTNQKAYIKKKILNISKEYEKEKEHYDKFYTLKEYEKFEKDLTNKMKEHYYEKNVSLNNSHFDQFIKEYQEKKSTNTSFTFEKEQVSAIKKALENKLSIITGPPGTGKSTICHAIIEYLNMNTTRNIICLAAPTGKALQSLMNNCTNISNKNLAGTCHKHVYHTFKMIKSNKNNSTIFNYEKMPFYKIDHIIIDETSMIDIFMMDTLIDYCIEFNCSITLVGDINQLPPINAGRPFECMINSTLFETTILTKIKRQDTGALKNFILDFKDKKLNVDNFDDTTCIHIPHNFNEEKKTQTICKQLVNDYGKDNIAFITPQNKYPGGVNEMTKLLQDIFNPENPSVYGKFKDGDFVMRRENDYGEEEIFVNGDCGIIKFNNDKKTATITYEDNRKESMSNSRVSDYFNLNYINTIHKFQGSQKKIIVFCSSNNHFTSFKNDTAKRLCLTACSRAQTAFILLGNKHNFINSQHQKEEKYKTMFMK